MAHNNKLIRETYLNQCIANLTKRKQNAVVAVIRKIIRTGIIKQLDPQTHLQAKRIWIQSFIKNIYIFQYMASCRPHATSHHRNSEIAQIQHQTIRVRDQIRIRFTFMQFHIMNPNKNLTAMNYFQILYHIFWHQSLFSLFLPRGIEKPRNVASLTTSIHTVNKQSKHKKVHVNHSSKTQTKSNCTPIKRSHKLCQHHYHQSYRPIARLCQPPGKGVNTVSHISPRSNSRRGQQNLYNKPVKRFNFMNIFSPYQTKKKIK